MKKKLAALITAVTFTLAPVVVVAPPAQATDCHVVAGRGCGGDDCNWMCRVGRIIGGIAVAVARAFP